MGLGNSKMSFALLTLILTFISFLFLCAKNTPFLKIAFFFPSRYKLKRYFPDFTTHFFYKQHVYNQRHAEIGKKLSKS